jgi:hypothetical protein
VLVDNRTDTAWFHALAGVCDRICLTRGRVNFYNETTTSSSPANGSVLFYLGDEPERFVRVFAQFGCCLKRVPSTRSDKDGEALADVLVAA